MRCIHCMQKIEDGASVCGFCRFPQDTPQKDPDALSPGTQLRNRFVLGRELGRGGFGITYVGYDNYLDFRVAIKEYYPQALAARLPGETKIYWRSIPLRDAGCQNVIREAQKMFKLRDLPTAVRVLDVFYENDTAYIAMDYVEGETLKEYLLKNGVLSPEECLELMMPVLDTMIQLHQAGIIHRDISPDNIMVQRDNTPRILDLGAAKDIQTTSGHTVPVAKNGFSPKEQYQTEGDIDTWTDVYSLCATMYYALTGKVPPAAMDRSEDGNDLTFRGPQPLPPKLCGVLRDGMRVRISQRIRTMAELKMRLEDSLTPDPPKPPVDPPKPPVDPPKPPVDPPEPPVDSKGWRSALLSLFGRKKDSRKPDYRNVKREPTQITVPDPDAPPCCQDPDATVCLGDEDETVLFDEAQPALANAYLLQPSTGRRIEITKCCFVVGRHAAAQAGSTGQGMADGVIENPDKHTSRRHAVIVFNGQGFYLQDISGKNKTMLNGVQLRNGTMPENRDVFPAAYPLYDGDSIQLANEELIFHVGGSL